MIKHVFRVLPGVLLSAFLIGCATSKHGPGWRQATTSIKVFGALESHVVGYYLRDGERHSFVQSLPFTLVETGLSEVEIRKAKPEDSITAEVQHNTPGTEIRAANLVAGPGTTGVRIQLKNGFSVEQLRD